MAKKPKHLALTTAQPLAEGLSATKAKVKVVVSLRKENGQPLSGEPINWVIDGEDVGQTTVMQNGYSETTLDVTPTSTVEVHYEYEERGEDKTDILKVTMPWPLIRQTAEKAAEAAKPKKADPIDRVLFLTDPVVRENKYECRLQLEAAGKPVPHHHSILMVSGRRHDLETDDHGVATIEVNVTSDRFGSLIVTPDLTRSDIEFSKYHGAGTDAEENGANGPQPNADDPLALDPLNPLDIGLTPLPPQQQRGFGIWILRHKLDLFIAFLMLWFTMSAGYHFVMQFTGQIKNPPAATTVVQPPPPAAPATPGNGNNRPSSTLKSGQRTPMPTAPADQPGNTTSKAPAIPSPIASAVWSVIKGFIGLFLVIVPMETGIAREILWLLFMAIYVISWAVRLLTRAGKKTVQVVKNSHVKERAVSVFHKAKRVPGGMGFQRTHHVYVMERKGDTIHMYVDNMRIEERKKETPAALTPDNMIAHGVKSEAVWAVLKKALQFFLRLIPFVGKSLAALLD